MIQEFFKKAPVIAFLFLIFCTVGGSANAGVLFPPEGQISQTNSCPEGKGMLMWKDGSVKCESVIDNMCPEFQRPTIDEDGNVTCQCPSTIWSEQVCPAGQVGSKIFATTISCTGKATTTLDEDTCRACPSVTTEKDWCEGGLEGYITYEVTTTCEGQETWKKIAEDCKEVGSYTTATTLNCELGEILTGNMTNGIFIENAGGTKFKCTTTGLAPL